MLFSKIFDAYNTIKKNIPLVNFYICLVLVFSLPFEKRIIPPIIAIWVLSWLLEGNFKNRFKNFSAFNIYFILLMTYYLWDLISVFYSKNLDSGLFDLEVKLSFLVFPIIFFGLNSNYKNKLFDIFKAFLFGNLVASFICLVVAFYRFFNIPDSELSHNLIFYYTVLSVFMHPSYFSMQILLCISIIIYFLIFNVIKSKKQIILYSFLLLYFIFFIYLLSSRAGLLTLSLICLCIIIYLSCSD